MKRTLQILHPAFKLNEIQFESVDELLKFASKLEREGDDHEISIGKFIKKWFDEELTIKVRTSGSTGNAKKIFLTKEAMMNSARATGTYFKLGEKTKALLCLPPNFIAGKMMVVRALVLGWDLHIVAPEKDALTQYDNDYDFVAMVPYQVLHSLEALEKVKKLIIGGGPIPVELEEKLQTSQSEIFATYGMTETCSHVAIRRINGPAASNLFSALPNIKFSIDRRSCLIIQNPSERDEEVVTNDLVEIETPTSFRWLGRYDNVINSGGVKVFPESIEQKLAPEIDLPFIIASEKDELLGERVVLILESNGNSEVTNYSKAFDRLEKYERPKKVYTISQFPYTQTGKIKRGDLKKVLRNYK